MQTTVRIVTTCISISLVTAALAGCTAAGPPPAAPPQQIAAADAEPSVRPSPAHTPRDVPADPCPWPRPSISLMQDGKNNGNAFDPDGGPVNGVLDGDLVDLGPREFAQGTVRYNDAREIVSYTVASNDVYELIYKRFCFTDYYDVISYNSGLEPMRSRPAYKGLEPGDVLILRPDPTVEWIPSAE